VVCTVSNCQGFLDTGLDFSSVHKLHRPQSSPVYWIGTDCISLFTLTVAHSGDLTSRRGRELISMMEGRVC